MKPQELHFIVRLWVVLMYFNAIGVLLAILLSFWLPGMMTKSGFPAGIYYPLMVALLLTSVGVIVSHKRKTGHAFGFSMAFLLLHLTGAVIGIVLDTDASARSLLFAAIGVVLLAVILGSFWRNRGALQAAL